ncbi:hypothetical protein V8D89_009421 [Ganoderma adspersum]
MSTLFVYLPTSSFSFFPSCFTLKTSQECAGTQVPGGSPLCVVYGSYEGGRSQSFKFLSVFTPGSTQARIQSTLCLLPIEQRVVKNRAIDHVQDLLVIVEWADVAVSGPMLPRLEEAKFYSLSGATVPSVVVFPQDGVDPMTEVRIFKICVAAEHGVIWELDQWMDTAVTRYSIDMWNWITGQLIKRIDVGRSLANFAPLECLYVLVTPTYFTPSVDIYSLSWSALNHRICALNEFHTSCQISAGACPATSEGHFSADPSLSMVPSVTLHTGDMQCEYASAAEHREPEENTGEWEAVRIPWADWGPCGCLRLRLQLPHRTSHVSLLPCGSHTPVVAFRGSDFKTDSIFVFDMNPLAARHAKQVLALRHDQSKPEETAIVEDVEAILPGVVDPECSAIPYVVYRFKLPYVSCSTDWSAGGQTIRAVEMSMTRFTVKFDSVSVEESLQSWTV